jgi:hypothetical protein
MTVCALQSSVHPRESESCVLQMVKAGAIPRIHTGVALFACGGKAGSRVGWGGCLLKVLSVAGVALR